VVENKTWRRNSKLLEPEDKTVRQRSILQEAEDKITPRRTDDNYADEAENGPLPLGFNWPCGLLPSAAFGKHFFLSLF
jgi:hypothetical protein